MDNLSSIYTRDPNESEESDGEGGLGNLNRLVVRPPGHSGKAKRGHLCFDAAFECGNLGRADHITELEYDLFLRPDTCRPRSRFWFNFTVENVKQDQRVIFNFINFGKDNNLYGSEMTPLVKSTSRPKWQRIPRRYTFYHRSSQHRGKHVLSVAFAFDREEDIFQFAAAAPYSYSRLQKYLAAWEKKADIFASRELLAQSTQKRRIDLITVGDRGEDTELPIKGRRGAARRRVVLLIARVHGGESPASYVCQGLMDFLASSSEAAQALRSGIILKIIPMLNPDGVFLGSQRSDLLGGDLNRAWHRATSFAHPALVAAHKMLDDIIADKTLQLDFILDIHAHISKDGVFVQGNSYDDVYRFERHAVLPKFIAARVEAWRADSCMYNADHAKTGTARRTLVVNRPSVDAYSLMVSLGGRKLTPRGPYLHYNEDAYARIGKALAKSLCDYYRHVGVIPPRVGSTEAKKPRARARGQRARRRRSEHQEVSQHRSAVRGTGGGPPPPPISEEAEWMRSKMPLSMEGHEAQYDDDVVPSTSHMATAESSDSSPERRGRCIALRTLELPPESPPPPLHRPRRPVRTAKLTTQDREPIIPLVTGFSVPGPRLAVVDMNSYVRAPGASLKLSRLMTRPARTVFPLRYTSDDYTTPDSDSY